MSPVRSMLVMEVVTVIPSLISHVVCKENYTLTPTRNTYISSMNLCILYIMYKDDALCNTLGIKYMYTYIQTRYCDTCTLHIAQSLRYIYSSM